MLWTALTEGQEQQQLQELNSEEAGAAGTTYAPGKKGQEQQQ